MRLPDVNVLVNAVALECPEHVLAKDWLDAAFEHPHGVALAWAVLIGFVRIATNPRITYPMIPVDEALAMVDEWLSHPRARIVRPGERHAGLVGRLLVASGTAGNLTNDAHLAALAIEHNAEVGTFDRDFLRFAGVRVRLLGRP